MTGERRGEERRTRGRGSSARRRCTRYPSVHAPVLQVYLPRAFRAPNFCHLPRVIQLASPTRLSLLTVLDCFIHTRTVFIQPTRACPGLFQPRDTIPQLPVYSPLLPVRIPVLHGPSFSWAAVEPHSRKPVLYPPQRWVSGVNLSNKRIARPPQTVNPALILTAAPLVPISHLEPAQLHARVVGLRSEPPTTSSASWTGAFTAPCAAPLLKSQASIAKRGVGPFPRCGAVYPSTRRYRTRPHSLDDANSCACASTLASPFQQLHARLHLATVLKHTLPLHISSRRPHILRCVSRFQALVPHPQLISLHDRLAPTLSSPRIRDIPLVMRNSAHTRPASTHRAGVPSHECCAFETAASARPPPSSSRVLPQLDPANSVSSVSSTERIRAISPPGSHRPLRLSRHLGLHCSHAPVDSNNVRNSCAIKYSH